jgi:hypothetical protein
MASGRCLDYWGLSAPRIQWSDPGHLPILANVGSYALYNASLYLLEHHLIPSQVFRTVKCLIRIMQ